MEDKIEESFEEIVLFIEKTKINLKYSMENALKVTSKEIVKATETMLKK